MRSQAILVGLSCCLVAGSSVADDTPPPVATGPSSTSAQPPATCTLETPPAVAQQTVPPTAPQPVDGRLDLRVGAYQQRRGMRFTQDPDASTSPPEYPGQPLQGITAHVGLFPFGQGDARHALRGLGVTLDASLSVASTFAGMDDTGSGEYELKHRTAQAGVVYGVPLGRAAVSGSLALGRSQYEIVDLPLSIQIPDVSYAYAEGGARIDADVFRGVRLGSDARYQLLLGGGDVSHQDWYGRGTGHGIVLATDVTIPLPQRMYVRAALEYRRISIEFEGSGMLAEQYGIWNMVDSALSGSAQLGKTF